MDSTLPDVQQFPSPLLEEYDFLSIVGASPRLQSVLVRIAQVAGMNIPVLIEGESGTGKELLARALHYNSDRHDRAFVAINCGAIPEQLLSSELFGYERGAFTGAVQATPGKFEVADGGTIFLDEVSEMPPGIQVALLRVLQNGEYYRLGATTPRYTDVRLVTATNRRLSDCIEARTFRHDLYYRLNVVHITVPPLRDRREDVPTLIGHFIQKYNALFEKRILSLSDGALIRLQHYQYPGNVRELENIIKAAVALASDKMIQIRDLPDHLHAASNAPAAPREAPAIAVAAAPAAASQSPTLSPPSTLAELRERQAELRDQSLVLERAFAENLLTASQGNVAAAAKLGAVGRTMLFNLLKRHDLRAEDFRREKNGNGNDHHS